MVRITEDMVRKRSEHNELQISTLEEISLHQQDIERIEHIDKWCRHLKILYLQSNLIPKIENVSRLKKLEYINLALNNVEKVENLEGCESLKKLDLTVNFVGELTSIECLKDLYDFKELFLTGNPCTDYEHYREYVIATLPQLQWLDGTQIEKSERIKAIQDLPYIRDAILQQQERHRKKREKQKAESQKESKENKDNNSNDDTKERNDEINGGNDKSDKHGFDGRWYTDINESDSKKQKEQPTTQEERQNGSGEQSHEEKVDDFWNEKVPFTPESRIDVHNHMKELKEKDEKKDESNEKPARRMFADDGRAFNVNEAKVDFTLTEDNENILLDVVIFKHMDSSLLDCDVQPSYVRVTLKGKIFQLCLDEEVNAEKSTAKRSQTTGHLLITMPKANPVIKQTPKNVPTKKTLKQEDQGDKKQHSKENFLEVNPEAQKTVDICNIVSENKANAEKTAAPFGSRIFKSNVQERSNSEDFVDDPDVPPLL